MTHSNAYVSTTMKTVVFCLSKKAKLFQWHWEITKFTPSKRNQELFWKH